MEIDFKKNLDKMRENYANHPLRFKILPKPTWMNKSDDLYQLYRDKKILFRYGYVYYAHIVQANTLLFDKHSHSNCPAEILFSTSPIAEESPLVLKSLAHEIYSYKNKPLDEVPKEYQDFARIITDELDRSCIDFPANVTKYTDIISEGVKSGSAVAQHFEDNYIIPMRLMAIMVFRTDVPGVFLQGSVYPLLAAPEKCKSAIMLPKQYYTEEFLMWKGHLTL